MVRLDCTSGIPLIETATCIHRTHTFGHHCIVTACGSIGNTTRTRAGAAIARTGITALCRTTDRIATAISWTVGCTATGIFAKIADPIATTTLTKRARQIGAGLIPERQTTERINGTHTPLCDRFITARVAIWFTALPGAGSTILGRRDAGLIPLKDATRWLRFTYTRGHIHVRTSWRGVLHTAGTDTITAILRADTAGFFRVTEAIPTTESGTIHGTATGILSLTTDPISTTAIAHIAGRIRTGLIP